ncbi:MAG: DUF411 domain-containing protein [Methylococcales bacterium]|nr:DUF411 domain-containing protein [Methylococcales bacterium]
MNKIILGIFFVLMNLSFSLKANEKVATAKPIEIEVYRSPTCGCCGKWIEHLKDKQFVVKDIVIDDVQVIKDKYGVPIEMASCHTALVDGYVVEGHVPAADIMKMINNKPKVIGISVPGMPVGTPGMDMGGRQDPYQVVSFDKEKNFKVVKSYKGKK